MTDFSMVALTSLRIYIW